MKKNLFYLHKDKVYGFLKGKKIEYSLDDFIKNPPRGEGILLIPDEKIVQKLVFLPEGQKTSLSNIIVHEVMELVDIRDRIQLKEKFVYGYRYIGKIENEDFYLILSIEKKEILALLEELKQKGLFISEVACTLDLLLNVCREHCKRNEDYFLFFDENIIYFVAFKQKVYVFHRKIEVTTSPVSDASRFWEEFLLEFKRSIFYAKQKYKLTPDTIAIITPPDWLYSHVAKLEEEFSVKEIDIISSGNKIWPEVPFLNICIQYPSILSSFVSLIPQELLIKKRLKRYSAFLSIIFLVLFFATYVTLFNYVKIYQFEEDNLLAILKRLNSLKKEKIINKKKIKDLNKIKSQLEEANIILNKRFFIDKYFEFLSYIFPKQVYLDKLTLEIDDQSNPVMVIYGNIEIKNMEKRVVIWEKIITQLKNSPLVAEVIETKPMSILENGKFNVKVLLRKIKE